MLQQSSMKDNPAATQCRESLSLMHKPAFESYELLIRTKAKPVKFAMQSFLRLCVVPRSQLIGICSCACQLFPITIYIAEIARPSYRVW